MSVLYCHFAMQTIMSSAKSYRIIFLTYSYSYTGEKFKHSYKGFFFRKVACKMYDVGEKYILLFLHQEQKHNFLCISSQLRLFQSDNTVNNVKIMMKGNRYVQFN